MESKRTHVKYLHFLRDCSNIGNVWNIGMLADASVFLVTLQATGWISDSRGAVYWHV